MLRSALIVASLALSLVYIPAGAEVRFGANVHVGGHDVSHQSFNRRRRGLFILHEGGSTPAGCAWRNNADGSKTKVCHYQVRH